MPGPNIGRSKTLTLSTFSPREKTEKAMNDGRASFVEEALQLLADRLEVKRDNDEQLVEAFTRIRSKAEALLLSLSRAGARSAGAAQPKKAIGAKDVKGVLGEIHTRLVELRARRGADARRAARQAAQGQGAAARRRRPAARAGQRRARRRARARCRRARSLGKQRLEELLAITDEMAATRNRLKQLMAEYKRTRSEETKKEIERELRQLERKLAELAQKAQRLASELPDQFLNREAMGDNNLQKKLDEVRQMMARGDINRAMAELDKLSQSLDRMMSSMERDLKGFRQERFSAEDKAMAEVENKLADLTEEPGGCATKRPTCTSAHAARRSG